MKLKDIFIKAKANVELIVTATHQDRLKMVEDLKSMRGWHIELSTTYKEGEWYLFHNYLNDFTISINTGKDSIYDDIIVNGR
jgi:hypothetical protein